jgi:hypothetical protein
MIYLDPAKLRFARIADVKGPALLVPHNRPDDMLLVGSGEDPLVCFLDGRWQGEGIRQRLAENWEGMAIEGVELVVDPQSLFSPDARGKVPLAAVRRGSAVGILVQAKTGHFAQVVTCDVHQGLPESSDDTRLAFGRWRIQFRDGDEVTELFSFALPHSGDS